MIVTKKALPRRTFLRGLGTMLSLPLLDAMVPSMTALAGTPAAPGRLRRLGFVFMPMGCDIARWTPPGATTLDVLAMIALRVLVVGCGWYLATSLATPPRTTAFIVPSQSVHW